LNQNISEDIYNRSITDSIKQFTELSKNQNIVNKMITLIQLIEMITTVE